jgi:hypothetical protein
VRNIVLVLAIAATATPVCAQVTPNIAGGASRLKTDVEVKQEQERESGYKSGVSKIPDAKGKVDPWSGVRAATPSSGQNPARPNAR